MVTFRERGLLYAKNWLLLTLEPATVRNQYAVAIPRRKSSGGREVNKHGRHMPSLPN